MKLAISQLIDDFQVRDLPGLVPRDNRLPAVVGKVDVVIGMRRTGKTFFCYQEIAVLLAAGTPRKNILYLNFEDDRLLGFLVQDFQAILDVYYGKYPEVRDSSAFFFFDEIQRIEHWEMFIRRLLDHENGRICLTGSSAKLLSGEIATSLRGRSLATEIFPFSFAEFLRAGGLFSAPPRQLGSKNAAVLRKAAVDYLEVGGFPEVQGLERHLRLEVLQGYIDAVLLRDVVERHGISNVIALKHLVRQIMNAPGGRFSVNKFYNTLKSMAVRCTKNSLYEYLDHLTEAYLFFRVPLHSRSEKSRLVNPAKIYVIDTGLINAMSFRNAANRGALLENLVFLHLRRNGYEIEYLNTADGFEVDFVARHKLSGEISLVQVCWDMSDPKTSSRELRGLQSGMRELALGNSTIVTWDEETLRDDKIRVVPIWKWLLE